MPKPAEVSDMWVDLVRWLNKNMPGQHPVAGGKGSQEADPS
jgi:hypothetical protein